ncbi:MAG: hypothetical protein ING80_11175 [Rhodocyclaceae bacterium]|jgi:hypothetical protein|nr:hypothetical protein [Rhodocyclaceae bacterium]MCE2899134.1 hypothetical protein [Betaproteobacteria bacterium]
MSLSPRFRKGLVFGCLGLTVAVLRGMDGEPEVTPAAAAPAEAARPDTTGRSRHTAQDIPREDGATAAPALRDPRGLRRRVERAARDAFAPRDWEPPAPRLTAAQQATSAAAAAPPPPQAPPLPFRYVGMLGEEDEQVTVFLERQDKGYAVKPGDLIDGEYRVEETGEGRVVFTYLPLAQRQVLVAGNGAGS